jgi:hypothetical protein
MDLFEAVCANSNDAGLRAQFDQAVQELVEAAAAVRVLKVQWGIIDLAQRRRHHRQRRSQLQVEV